MLLDADGVPWAAPNLTVSFAPDGTNVAGFESTLFQKLDSLTDQSLWQDAIVRGFDVWAQHTSASITTTADSGDAFGTPGPTQGDSRFGDVRVAAIPMADDIIAMSIPHDEVISGTWAGDILFNSNADVSSIDDVFAVAVHEAGHVFGLGHSTDPNSPMFTHGIATHVTPTAADIIDLQQLYGVTGQENGADGGDTGRGGDDDGEQETEHDREHSDDQLVAAKGLMLSPNFQGAIRYDVSGQIFDTTDVDFYQLAPIDDEFEQADVLTVTVRAATPAGLAPTAVIYDQDGKALQSTVLSNANGELVVQVKDADPRKLHFIEVSAEDPSGTHATGAYSFHAAFGTRETTLDRIAHGTLKPDETTHSTVLHVSETRLMHFVLAADPVETPSDALIWTAVYDANGSPVFRAAARPGENRSANTVLLAPGDYRIEFHEGDPTDAVTTEIDYRLFARSVSLPVGPTPIDPTGIPILPCSNAGADPVYCTPSDVAVVDPFILPDPTPVKLPNPIVTIPPPWLDPALWYWDGVIPPKNLPAPIGTAPPIAKPKPIPTPTPTPTPTSPPAPEPPRVSWQNAAQPQDVDGDGFVAPIDVLLVIDFLNAHGSQPATGNRPADMPFYDVNNDGFIAPVDVLEVINNLNQSSSAAAEGEATSLPPASPEPTTLLDVPSTSVVSTQPRSVSSQSVRAPLAAVTSMAQRPAARKIRPMTRVARSVTTPKGILDLPLADAIDLIAADVNRHQAAGV